MSPSCSGNNIHDTFAGDSFKKRRSYLVELCPVDQIMDFPLLRDFKMKTDIFDYGGLLSEEI